MCNNNSICNCFSGNNLWWILILILLFCNCGGSTYGGNCGGGCYHDNNNCGCGC